MKEFTFCFEQLLKEGLLEDLLGRTETVVSGLVVVFSGEVFSENSFSTA
jgi:hypothetical protein